MIKTKTFLKAKNNKEPENNQPHNKNLAIRTQSAHYIKLKEPIIFQ